MVGSSNCDAMRTFMFLGICATAGFLCNQIKKWAQRTKYFSDYLIRILIIQHKLAFLKAAHILFDLVFCFLEGLCFLFNI